MVDLKLISALCFFLVHAQGAPFINWDNVKTQIKNLEEKVSPAVNRGCDIFKYISPPKTVPNFLDEQQPFSRRFNPQQRFPINRRRMWSKFPQASRFPQSNWSRRTHWYPQAARFPQAPRFSQAPRYPQAPSYPQAPEFPQAPRYPELPQATESPKAPELPNDPEPPQTPKMPQATESPPLPQDPSDHSREVEEAGDKEIAPPLPEVPPFIPPTNDVDETSIQDGDESFDLEPIEPNPDEIEDDENEEDNDFVEDADVALQ